MRNTEVEVGHVGKKGTKHERYSLWGLPDPKEMPEEVARALLELSESDVAVLWTWLHRKDAVDAVDAMIREIARSHPLVGHVSHETP